MQLCRHGLPVRCEIRAEYTVPTHLSSICRCSTSRCEYRKLHNAGRSFALRTSLAGHKNMDTASVLSLTFVILPVASTQQMPSCTCLPWALQI